MVLSIMQKKRKFMFLPASVLMFVHKWCWELVCLGVCVRAHTAASGKSFVWCANMGGLVNQISVCKAPSRSGISFLQGLMGSLANLNSVETVLNVWSFEEFFLMGFLSQPDLIINDLCPCLLSTSSNRLRHERETWASSKGECVLSSSSAVVPTDPPNPS